MHPSHLFLSVVVFLVVTPSWVSGQEAPLVYPGHPDLDVAVFQPFEAEYIQSGVAMTVRTVLTGDAAPILSTVMLMHGAPLATAGLDHIGHYANDLRFAYRTFGFGRWGQEYVHAEARRDTLAVSRMPTPLGDRQATFVEQPIAQPFFDGTLAYWLLAALPLEEGYQARLADWGLTEQGVEIDTTPPFEVIGQETITLADGTAYPCWVVAVTGAQFTLHTYVTRAPPYLIRQRMIPQEGDPLTVVELKRLITPSAQY